ncbi:MAG: hypothetical protein KF749_15565 [Bacteroidetes bacterium]|nr:hypothetical protein [Bacteroidota bacterium]
MKLVDSFVMGQKFLILGLEERFETDIEPNDKLAFRPSVIDPHPDCKKLKPVRPIGFNG